MRILVSAAGRHGATVEIADRIGAVLRARLAADGSTVVVGRPDEIAAVAGFDAYVLGSAIYMGHWLESMRQLVRDHAVTLRTRPVWLFSSGPIGDPPKPDEQPVDSGNVIMLATARDHRVFAGKLDRDRLGFAERAMATALRAPYGDFRDWTAIETWAAGIADELSASPATSGATVAE